jgi:hypothetical protein
MGVGAAQLLQVTFKKRNVLAAEQRIIRIDPRPGLGPTLLAGGGRWRRLNHAGSRARAQQKRKRRNPLLQRGSAGQYCSG